MHDTMPLPSNRSFGTVFVVFFALLGVYSWWRAGTLFPWYFGASAVVLLFTLAIPKALTPFNRAWMKLAEILNRIVSPIILGAIFFGVFTPIAMAMRVAGRDIMKRKFEAGVQSYWTRRDPPGPAPASLPNQF